jgi:hypothetical protein
MYPLSGAEPPYQPGVWNFPLATRQRNNCYNYACNKQTNTFAQPGRFGGMRWTALTCANVGAAARRDGLAPTVCYNQACPCGSYKVALVIWPNRDFHWYRQDDNGNWSHKPGKTAATNKDNAGNAIVDPQLANRGPYTTFCECFCVDANAVNIR